jgi:hypothetical protein
MTILLNVQESYPLNGTTSFPIGEEIYLEFSNLVDDKSAKESIHLIDSTARKIVEADYTVTAIDENGLALLDDFTERQASQRTVVSLKPKQLLSAHTKYELVVRGVSLEQNSSLVDELDSNTISERTVFRTTFEDSFTELVRVYGSFEGLQETNINVEIVESGSDSQAKYIWWFENKDKPASNSRNLSRTLSRWRSLDKGCYIKFYGGSFNKGDTFKIKVYPKNKLMNSYKINFSTSSEDLLVRPKVISESDIGINIPSSFNSSLETSLKVIDVSPKDGSINNPTSTDKIIITFNKELNPESINQNTVKLIKQPVSGSYNGASKEQKIPKEIFVNGNKIVLEF